MVAKTKTMRIGIAALALALAALGAVAGMLYALHVNGAALRATTQVFADRAAHEQTYSALSDALGETESARARVRSYVLHGEADTVTFLSEIDSLAGDVGVALNTTKLEVVPIEQSEYHALRITFEIEGGEEPVVRLISLLEALPYQSHVAQATLTRMPDGARAASTVLLSVLFQEE